MKWKLCKASQSFYSLTADRLCGKIERMSPRSQHTIQVLCFGDMGGGDCTWKGIRSHGRHLSFKRLIRECACRCPVFMMDEYGTSLTCPGCGSEMVTTDKINRLRTCAKFLREGKSCLASISSDRDERSAAQMVLGALCHMIHGKRPKHLARNNSSSNEEDACTGNLDCAWDETNLTCYFAEGADEHMYVATIGVGVQHVTRTVKEVPGEILEAHRACHRPGAVTDRGKPGKGEVGDRHQHQDFQSLMDFLYRRLHR